MDVLIDGAIQIGVEQGVHHFWQISADRITGQGQTAKSQRIYWGPGQFWQNALEKLPAALAIGHNRAKSVQNVGNILVANFVEFIQHRADNLVHGEWTKLKKNKF